MISLAPIWKHLEDLTIYDAGLLLIGIDPYPHNHRCLIDDEYALWTSEAFVSERVRDETEVLVSAAYAKKIQLTLDSRNTDGTLDISLARVAKDSFIKWCKTHKKDELGDLLAATVVSSVHQMPQRLTTMHPPQPWITVARQIAQEMKKKYPKLSQDQIASKVHGEMVQRHANCESGMTGRGNKVPSAESIKRHALKGI